MPAMNVECDRTCRGRCTALEIAMKHEKEAILRYGAYRDECVYPDVKALLNELIIRHQKMIQILEEARLSLDTRFGVLDQIQDAYNV